METIHNMDQLAARKDFADGFYNFRSLDSKLTNKFKELQFESCKVIDSAIMKDKLVELTFLICLKWMSQVIGLGYQCKTCVWIWLNIIILTITDTDCAN